MSTREEARRSQTRLAALRASGLLDTAPTEALDRLSRLAAQMLDVPVTFLSLVDEDRDFYLSHCGLGGELAETRELRGETFCHFGLVGQGPVVIDDTRALPEHRAVPTVDTLGVSAYLGIPIRSDGDQVLGSFCAVDFKPRKWSKRDVEILEGLAGAVRAELNLLTFVGDAVREAERAGAARHEAEVRSRTSQQILNAVSHDLRSPLNSLVLALGNIELTCDHPTAVKASAIARRQASLMKALLDDLLDNARIAQGSLRLSVEPVDVRALLEEILEDFAGTAEASDLLLVMGDMPHLPSFFLDRSRIRQVLSNLLSNAFKFTPRGGRVRIDARCDGDKLVLVVADTGKGIDPAMAKRVFEPYWQADSGSRIGIGLGLHIAEQIVAMHGGNIGIRETVGGGATFVIEIPARGEPAAGRS